MQRLSRGEMGLSPVNILLVDDRPENLTALMAVLSSDQHHLVCASSGEEALRQVIRQDFAVILLDVMMPGMDGYEVASILSQRERTRGIPIIFLTAVAKEKEHLFKAYSVGAVDFLHKPLDPEVVRAKVAVFVDLYRKTQQIKEQAEQLRQLEKQQKELELSRVKNESERRVLDIITSVQGVVWEAQGKAGAPQGLQLTFVSEYSKNMFGFTPDEWLGHSTIWHDSIHPADREKYFQTLQMSLETGNSGTGRFRAFRRDGQMIWIAVRMVATRDLDGNIAGLRGITLDISEQKKAEEWQDFLAEAGTVLASSLDSQQTIQEITRRMVPLLGDWCLVELLDETGVLHIAGAAHKDPDKLPLLHEMREKFPPQHLEKHPMKRVLQTGEPVVFERLEETFLAEMCQSSEYLTFLQRLGVASALIVPIQIRGRAVGALTLVLNQRDRRYESRDLQRLIELVRHISMAVDNASLYQKVKEAVQIRDEFISIASHELKTPVTSIKLQTQMLLRTIDQKGPDTLISGRIEKLLVTSNRQIDKLTRLIEDMLDISRISLGKFSMKKESVDLGELVNEVIDKLCDQLGLAGCETRLKVEDEISGVWDRFRIEQVLDNLLTNAIKYGRGKPIEVKLSKKGDSTAVISVKDYGMGIPKEHQTRIFDRYERAISASAISGLGLGLYIAKQILDAHHGIIYVNSSPGVGSEFIVELPLNADDQLVTEYGAA